MIVWQSLPDAIIHNSGKVRFIDTPDDGCTLIHVTIAYQPPAGILGAGIAQVINPMFKKMVEDDIQNFKKYMDIGEIAEEIAVITISEQPD